MKILDSIETSSTLYLPLNVNDQQITVGGRLFDVPSYEGFLQTDREGRTKGVIALDPQEFITH
jgi:hypothetical protein